MYVFVRIRLGVGTVYGLTGQYIKPVSENLLNDILLTKEKKLHVSRPFVGIFISTTKKINEVQFTVSTFTSQFGTKERRIKKSESKSHYFMVHRLNRLKPYDILQEKYYLY